MKRNHNTGFKAFMDHLPWSGSRLGGVLFFFIIICTQVVGLYGMGQRPNMDIFQTKADSPKEEFINAFYEGNASTQIQALALYAEAKKLNLDVSDDMIDTYTKNMKIFQENESFSKSKYDEFLNTHRISKNNLSHQIRIRMLSEMMQKIISTACKTSVKYRIPTKVVVDLIYMKETPQSPSNLSENIIKQMITKSIRDHSVLVLEPHKMSGQVMIFDPYDVLVQQVLNSNHSHEYKMNQLQTLKVPIQKIFKQNAVIDEDPAAHTLFHPYGTVFQTQRNAYTGKVDRVQSAHIKNEISAQDLQLLMKRAGGYAGSIEELSNIISQLHKNGYNPHAISNTYTYKCVYELNHKVARSNYELFLFTAKEGQVLLWYDDKPCIAYVREVVYEDSLELNNILQQFDLSQIIIQNMCIRFARSNGVF